jgi:uncharacterized protein YbcI
MALPPPTGAEDQTEALAASLADLHAILTEERPDEVETASSQGVLTCVLKGGLTRQETYLIELGHGSKVRAFREELFRAADDDLATLVKMLTGRSVRAWVPVFEPDSGLTTLVFVLGGPADTLGDLTEALAAWDAQVRSKSQSLREARTPHIRGEPKYPAG